MNKDKKRVLFFIKPYTIDEFEAYLEKMAEKGWMFTCKKGPALYFSKIKPSKIHFTVDIFNDASSSDIRPTYYTEEYVSFCEESGWTLIQNTGKLMIFCSEESDPVPIQSDPAIKLETIVKLTKKEVIFPFCLFFLLALANIISGITLGMGPSYILVSSGNMPLSISYLLIAALFGFDVLQFAVFYRKNKERAAKGDDLIFKSSKRLSNVKHVYAVILTIAIIINIVFTMRQNGTDFRIVLAVITGYLIITLAIEWFRQGNKKINEEVNELLYWTPSVLLIIILIILLLTGGGGSDENKEHLVYTEKNNSVEMTIYHEKIPFTLEDLGVTVNGAAHVETFATEHSTLFGKSAEYMQTFYDKTLEPIGDGLECEIIESRFAFIVDDFVRDKREYEWTTWRKGTAEELRMWGAEELYAGDDKADKVVYRIVKWKDKALLFYGQDVKINEKTIAVIKENSNLY